MKRREFYAIATGLVAALFGAKTHAGESLEQKRWEQRRIYFVNSSAENSADKPGNGTSLLTPFKTFNYARKQCKPHNNDWIYMMPGHVEYGLSSWPCELNEDGIGYFINGVKFPCFHDDDEKVLNGRVWFAGPPFLP